MTTTSAKEILKQRLRAAEILEETRRVRLAEEAAAALDMPAGEPIVGIRQTAAAYAKLANDRTPLDDEDALAAALAAVGTFRDDVTVIPAAPLESEPVVGQDNVEAARKLLSQRGQEETEETLLAALVEVQR